MNVTQLSLTPRQYGRANYIKTEIMNFLRYVRVLAPNKKPVALTFMDEARALVYDELGEDLPATLPAGSAPVANAATVAVRNSAGADSHNATAVVTAGALTGVNLAATAAMVDQADAVTVVNSAGADGHAGTVAVAAGAVTNVALPATVAMVDNADVVVIQNSAGAVRGASGSAIVAAGVVTAVRTPATSAVVVGGVQAGVTVTGTYTTSISFTITAGALTAVTLA